jgi:hypothetical protein
MKLSLISSKPFHHIDTNRAFLSGHHVLHPVKYRGLGQISKKSSSRPFSVMALTQIAASTSQDPIPAVAEVEWGDQLAGCSFMITI